MMRRVVAWLTFTWRMVVIMSEIGWIDAKVLTEIFRRIVKWSKLGTFVINLKMGVKVNALF